MVYSVVCFPEIRGYLEFTTEVLMTNAMYAVTNAAGVKVFMVFVRPYDIAMAQAHNVQITELSQIKNHGFVDKVNALEPNAGQQYAFIGVYGPFHSFVVLGAPDIETVKMLFLTGLAAERGDCVHCNNSICPIRSADFTELLPESELAVV